MMNILIIEDEANVARVIRTCLEGDGFTCAVASDGESGLEKFRKILPDVIVLDLGLPKMDGIDLCSCIRQSKKLKKDPYILMLTARNTEAERIIGFSTGADDYLAKPFSPQELLVRVRALVRRSLRYQQPDHPPIETAHFFINVSTREVYLRKESGTQLIDMPRGGEFDLFCILASRPGRIWNRNDLIEAVWGIDATGGERMIDTYIKRIRDRTSPSGERERFVKTHFGVGYSFEDQPYHVKNTAA